MQKLWPLKSVFDWEQTGRVKFAQLWPDIIFNFQLRLLSKMLYFMIADNVLNEINSFMVMVYYIFE